MIGRMAVRELSIPGRVRKQGSPILIIVGKSGRKPLRAFQIKGSNKRLRLNSAAAAAEAFVGLIELSFVIIMVTRSALDVTTQYTYNTRIWRCAMQKKLTITVDEEVY